MPSCKTRIEWKNKTAPIFTWTTAMDCWSFSLLAGKEGSCPMFYDAPDSICRSCYAMTGRYNMRRVVETQYVRYRWTSDSLRSPESTDKWVQTMIDAIRLHTKKTEPYFRVHDSGDLFSVPYIEAWSRVCKSINDIKFWFPTRAWRFRNIKWVTALKTLRDLDNVTVRPSALLFDEDAPEIEFLDAGTAVINTEKLDGHLSCPKSIEHTSCGTENCRVCWDSPSKKITYLMHGYSVSNKIKTNRKNAVLTLNGKGI